MNVEEYLQKFYKGTKNPTLDAMNYFMKKLGEPHKHLKVIHVAGTNGKGSCCEMMANILMNSNYKVGKFISPHLIKYNERISINNQNISDRDMEDLIIQLEPLIEEYNRENINKVTLFELETTMAILYFYRNKCDFVILEVGLGGLYDCTNIITPIVSIINSIGHDHMHILGNSLEEIAFKKAGIIKENSTTVFIEQEENEVNKVIKNACQEKNNQLHLIKKEQVINYSYNKDFQIFNYKNYKDIEINLKGKIQIYNAILCLESINILKDKFYIPEESIKYGLKTVVHRARFEKINDSPTIVYDGAHNLPAIINLNNTIDMYYKNNKKVFIVSILKTKDYKGVLKTLIKNYKDDIFIFTDGNNSDRYISKEEMYKEANKILDSNIYKMSLEDAIKTSIKNYRNHTIFVVGTLYIYGDVLKIIDNY